MLASAFEWERLIHLNPTDEMVTRRKAIVASVLTSFDSEQDVDEVFRLVSAAITGLSPDIAADVEYGQVLTDVTKDHHAAFPSLLSENALDLQLTACLAVGELLMRRGGKQVWMEPQTAVASVCVSSAGLSPNGKGLHLTGVQDALLAASRDRLTRAAAKVRTRPEYDSAELDELAPSGDVAAFWGQLKPFLESAFETLTRVSAIDRDELEVLWWLYNDRSLVFGKALSEMAAYDVAFAAPIELVNRALCPAPSSLTNIVLGHVARGSGKPSNGRKALKSVIGAWSVEIIRSLLPKEEDVQTLVSTCPKVLPLTWIAGKIADSGVITGWEKEFASRTGLNANLKISPDEFANQVFAERTAQRLLAQFSGEES
jgi:hypothetical protein